MAANLKQRSTTMENHSANEGNGKMDQVTMNDELANILDVARQDTEGRKLLKFRVNEAKFYLGEDEVALGTEFVAHCRAWEREWSKLDKDGKKIVDGSRKRYRVAKHERPDDRNDLGDLDESKWPRRDDGTRFDPWLFQYRLPLENLETGEVLVFVTGSAVGGRI